MRCSGKKFLVSSDYLIGKVTLNFPVPFPALCCALISNTCANKQEEMREAPFFLHPSVQCSLKLGNSPKQYVINTQCSGSRSNAFKSNSQCSPSPFTDNSDIPLHAATFCSFLLHLLASSKCNRGQTSQGNCQAVVSKTYMHLIKDFYNISK